jgi:DNA invertase Pin-like site-specific DNA recombinase
MTRADLDSRVDVDYNRISDDKSGAAAGVGSQHEENEDFAEGLGLSLRRTYTDNDRSAYSGVERPEFLRMLDDIRADKIRSVTFWHANRGFRNTDEVNAFIRLCRAHGVKVYSTSKGEAYNLEKAAGRKQLRDDTSEAEYESEHRGERVALARKRQARNGDYGGGWRPYGWGVDTGRVRSVCVNPKAPAMDRVYEDRPVLNMTLPNAEEAEEIRHWEDELMSGVPMAQVLRDIAARGVLTVAQKEGRVLKRNGREVAHGGWSSKTVRQILTHPRTSGHSVYQGKIVKRNAFPAIIEEDRRQALITHFADPARKTSPGNTPRWLGSLIYRCGACDDDTVMSVRKNAQGQFIYRCRAHGHCVWHARELDKYIENVMVGLLHRDNIAEMIQPAKEIDAAALYAEVKVLEAKKADAARKNTLGSYDDAVFETILATADQRIAEIWDELSEGTDESPLSDFARSQDARETWDAQTLGRKREILRRLVVVTLPPVGRGRKASMDLIQVRKRENPGAHAA